METKVTIVAKILAEIGTGKITLTDAIAKANVMKQAKGANQVRVWRAEFKKQGLLTKENKVFYVANKPVASAPQAAPQTLPVAVSTPETPAVQTTTNTPTA